MASLMRFALALLVSIAPLGSAAAQNAPDRERAPMIAVAPKVKDLLGKEGRDVERLLGRPRIAHAQGDGAMWTYQRPGCALHVFFRRNGAQDVLRVSGISSGPLQRGGAAPDVERCLAAGEVR